MGQKGGGERKRSLLRKINMHKALQQTQSAVEGILQLPHEIFACASYAMMDLTSNGTLP